MDNIKWTYTAFDQLTVQELYEILRLRSAVFVVEQNCVYLDLDDKDQRSYHLCGSVSGKLVAYARILPPGLAFDQTSIGRVCSSANYRNKGAGRALMVKAIQKALDQFAGNIMIGAQLYLKEFYASLGFLPTGEQYLEDGIPHIHMILPK